MPLQRPKDSLKAQEPVLDGNPPVQVVPKEEVKRLFEEEVYTTTGLSTEQFIEKWKKGELEDTTANARLVMMIPLEHYKSA